MKKDMEKEEYKKSVLEYKDVQGAILCAREDGVEEGFEQGMEKGRMEGLNEGKCQLVRNMLAEGIDLEIIERISGLEQKEILAMQQ